MRYLKVRKVFRLEIIYILGGFAVGQGLFQLVMLFSDRKNNTKGQYVLMLILAFFTLSILEYSLVWTQKIELAPHLLGFTNGMQFLFLPLIYIFYQSETETTLIKRNLISHLVPFFIVAGFLSPVLFQSAQVKLSSMELIYYFTISVAGLHIPLCIIFLLQASVYAYKILQLDNKHLAIFGRVLLRLFFLYIFIHICHTIIIFFYPALLPVVGLSVLFISVVSIYALSYYLFRRQTIIREEKLDKYANSNLALSDAEAIIRKLDKLISEDNYFTDSEIRMSEVSKKINVPLNKLSQAINQIKGVSFRVYLNQIRIKYAVARIDSSKSDKISLKEIFYDAGFNNKTSFANAFKKQMSMTPSQYISLRRNK